MSKYRIGVVPVRLPVISFPHFSSSAGTAELIAIEEEGIDPSPFNLIMCGGRPVESDQPINPHFYRSQVGQVKEHYLSMGRGG